MMVGSVVSVDSLGHTPSLEELEAFRPMARAMAVRIVGSATLADDIVQDAMVRAVEAVQHGVKVTKPKAWFRRIVVHAALDALKQGLNGETPIGEPSTKSGADMVSVQSVLDSLSPDHRLVLELAFGERLSYKEIAFALDIPVGTVGSRINAARTAFKAAWGEGL